MSEGIELAVEPGKPSLIDDAIRKRICSFAHSWSESVN